MCRAAGMTKTGTFCLANVTPALPPGNFLFYADLTFGVLVQRTMQRCTARFLLLLALVGTFLPLALSARTPSAHACCLRAAHHCHSTSESEQSTIGRINSCGHDCCRGATTSQTAHPKPTIAILANQFAATRAPESMPSAPLADVFSFTSTRAPPIIANC